MLKAFSKAIVRPIWRPVRHRIESIVRAEHSTSRQDFNAALGMLIASVENLALAARTERAERETSNQAINETLGALSALTEQLISRTTDRPSEPRSVVQPSPRRMFPFWEVTSEESAAIPETLRGRCPVCSARATFSGFTSNVRESGRCSACGSFNRQRQMAKAVRTAHGIHDDASLDSLAGRSIYNTETTGAMHQVLRGLPDYVASEYFGPDLAPGATVDGRRHEDLQHLSFPSESFDLVLSSDVMEHMPDPYAAHREILRVLKPGGRHIFTVPFDPSLPRDDVRACLVEGEVVHLAERLFHGDPVRPDEGVLVWTIFGLEMLPKLQALGFDVSAWNVHSPAAGILGVMPFVFEARRPPAWMPPPRQ